MTIYNFDVKTITGDVLSMKEFENKVLLIVNTASKCGLTKQLKELETVYQTYKDKNFEILGFPCGQFKDQELDNNDEIHNFCQRNYGVTFKMFDKIDVNGEQAHPLYKFLKQEAKGVLNSEIKWNFTKFLVDANGTVVKRYAPTTNPLKLTKDIEKLLN